MYVHVGGSSSYDSVLDFLILFVFFLKRLVLSVGEGGSDLKVWTIPLVRRVKRYSKGTAIELPIRAKRWPLSSTA